MADKYDVLKLDNQICFPLYACSKEIVRRYKPFLDKLDLTYTQYITMMVMWEYKEMNVKELGEKLYLDSGTLTPVLKKLEQKNYVSRKRDEQDERVLKVTITKQGEDLKDKALDIPAGLSSCISLDAEDAKCLFRVLRKMMDGLKEE